MSHFSAYICIALQLAAITPALVAALTNYGGCVTAHNETGQCVQLLECNYFYKKLMTGEISSDEELYLQDSQCGHDNTQVRPEKQVLLCCAANYLMQATSSMQQQKPGNTLPDADLCGNIQSRRSKRIIYGGGVTKIAEFPWMALLEYKKPNNTYGFHCGGSLISNRYVLTAAHCVQRIHATWQLYSVRLGEWNLSTNPDCNTAQDDRTSISKQNCAPPHLDMPIERSIVHANFERDSRDQFNDIALLRLQQPINYTDYIQPVCLPLAAELRDNRFAKFPMTVAGWGLTESLQASDVKLKTVVEVWADLSQCQQKYRTQHVTVDSAQQLCAGGENQVDACRGDSGGPLMVSWKVDDRRIMYLAGIVSYGPTPCGLADWPGVYTRVGAFIDWILQNLAP